MIHKSPHPSPNISRDIDKKRAAQTAICTTQSSNMSASLNSDYITNSSTCQASDLKELVEIFRPKRNSSELLSESFLRLSFRSRALRTSLCGTILTFKHSIDDLGIIDPHGKLHDANFCRDRLCPMCGHRRSLKIFAQVSRIMSAIGNKLDFLFLTLTVPNCPPDELDSTLTKLFKGFDRLFKRQRVKRAVDGYFRALEVTRNDANDTYHPHFHIVLGVKPSYFASRDYISQADWLQMWRDAYGDQTITQVDIRKAKPKSNGDCGSVVAEIAKYTVKDTDYIFPGDPDKTDRVISILALALKHRRLVQYGGIFKALHKELNLDDPDDGDLIHVDGHVHPALAYIVNTYHWSVGIGSYRITSSQVIGNASLVDPNAPNGSVLYLDLPIPDESE